MNWVKDLISDTAYENITLKILDKGYPPFDIPQSLVKEVSEEEFVKNRKE